MTNSYESFLQILCESILTDWLEHYPTDRLEVGRDLSRLASLVINRGPKVFTLDLPALGKHFDLCLSRGRLTSSNLPLSRSYCKKSTIPRLFREMYLRVFDDSGLIRSDVDIQAVKYLRQIFYFAKKYKATCEPERIFDAVKEFFDIEKEIRRATHSWDADDFSSIIYGTVGISDGTIPDHIREPDLFGPPESTVLPQYVDSVQRTFDLVAAQLGGFNPSEWRSKHGPGAVSDQRRYLNKFQFPHWPNKLEAVFPQSEFAFANEGFWLDNLQQGDDSYVELNLHEPASKLIAVPKTMKGPRLICSEPTSHQWCQQAVKEFLVKRLSCTVLRNSISFASQEKSGRAALQASLDDHAATIDLSSASDRLSCWLVERAFRRNFSLLQAFHAVRTRWVVNKIDKKSPSFHKLRKFTTQGSALTFPVQSIVFASIALGVTAYCRKLPITIKNLDKLSKEVRVFGDDIIVPKDVGYHVVECLTYLGLKVNSEKTFLEGNFKESCGVDAFCGHDVTPGYVMRIPTRIVPNP